MTHTIQTSVNNFVTSVLTTDSLESAQDTVKELVELFCRYRSHYQIKNSDNTTTVAFDNGTIVTYVIL